MTRIALEHTASFVLVVLLSLGMLSWIRSQREKTSEEAIGFIESYLSLDSLDLADPLQAVLFKETLEKFYPTRASFRDSVARALDVYRVRKMVEAERAAAAPSDVFSREFVFRLGRMYAQFVLVFLIAIVLIYYGARIVAVHRFTQARKGLASSLQRLSRAWSDWTQGKTRGSGALEVAGLCGMAVLKGLGFLVLFSPAYVLAYSLKIEINSGNLLMMVILAVISNGLLINYSNKFFIFLVQESRKGYVETAIVKGLESEYSRSTSWISSLSVIFFPQKRYSHHVFKHIYLNARFQFIPSVKELAAFLVTGLIIIEMALNVQGHLCYQLLQSLLFHQYDVAVTIGLGIFLVVKATELGVDLWREHEARKFRNGILAQ